MKKKKKKKLEEEGKGGVKVEGLENKLSLLVPHSTARYRLRRSFAELLVYFSFSLKVSKFHFNKVLPNGFSSNFLQLEHECNLNLS